MNSNMAYADIYTLAACKTLPVMQLNSLGLSNFSE